MQQPTGPLGLPSNFVFGVSTASYQIEGAVDEDGRGRTVWDDFCDRPGAINAGSSGAVACDHYHRYPEDIALMDDLGVSAYRFSVAWSRIQPEGRGPANPAGLDFYDRLIDGLCAAGIAPAATLFHWDLPSALEAEGGWRNRDTAERFADYAALMVERFGDRVAMWIPVNEPVVVTVYGYGLGMHAPGHSLGLEALPVAHHLLLGHGLAVAALRDGGARSVGTANNHSPVWPETDSDADRQAADVYDTIHNRMFADPMLLGRYPEGFADLMPGPVADDLRIISAPLDFYGVNYYNPMAMGAPREGEPTMGGLPFAMRGITGYPTTDFGWPVVPDGLRELLVLLRDRYGSKLPPVYITENGCSYGAGPDAEGRVRDPERITYLDSHLRAIAAARAEGVDVRGYFCWSLMDNFEWAEGYTQRFGLVHIDYDTLVRTPKDSYHWYADAIAQVRRG